MAELQDIDVTIKPDGTVEVSVRGVQGPGCLVLTKEMERYLGGEIRRRHMTPEYDQATRHTQEQEKDRLDLGR